MNQSNNEFICIVAQLLLLADTSFNTNIHPDVVGTDMSAFGKKLKKRILLEKFINLCYKLLKYQIRRVGGELK